MGITGSILVGTKNLMLIVLLSLHCEKFYAAVEDVETACTLHLMNVHCTGKGAN